MLVQRFLCCRGSGTTGCRFGSYAFLEPLREKGCLRAVSRQSPFGKRDTGTSPGSPVRLPTCRYAATASSTNRGSATGGELTTCMRSIVVHDSAEIHDRETAMVDSTRLVQQVPVPHFLYGTAWKEYETQRLTALALRQGFRGIDTANRRRHYYEEGVGRAISEAIAAGLVLREELFLQTKFTFRQGQDQRLPMILRPPCRPRSSSHSRVRSGTWESIGLTPICFMGRQDRWD